MSLSPQPPARPLSTDQMLLGAQRRYFEQQKNTDANKTPAEAEVERLKQLLADQEHRLTSQMPAAGAGFAPSPPRDAPAPLRGERYNTTAHTPSPRRQKPRGDPFDDDPEVRQWLEKVQRSEERLARHSRAIQAECARRSAADADRAARVPQPPALPPAAPSPHTAAKAAATTVTPTSVEPVSAADQNEPLPRMQDDEEVFQLGLSDSPTGKGRTRGLSTGTKPEVQKKPVTPQSQHPDAPHSPPFGQAVSEPASEDESEASPAPVPLAPHMKRASFVATSQEILTGSHAPTPTPGSSRVALTRKTSSIFGTSQHVMESFDMKDFADLVLPNPEGCVEARTGDILSGSFVLKRDLFRAAFSRRDTVGVMGGAPAFRMIPKFNVGAVAQAHISGFRTILNEVTKQWAGPCLWINLREEPVIYINSRSYIVRAAKDPMSALAMPGMQAERIEDLEVKLRTEVLREGEGNGGNVCVHKEDATGTIEAQWEAVDDASVKTLRTVFEELPASYKVKYTRLPVGASTGVVLKQFDVMFDLCVEHPHDPIIVNCQTGRGRSTVAMIIACIVRFYQNHLREPATGKSLLAGAETQSGFRKLAQLVSILPNGPRHERRVGLLAELTGKASNLVDRIASAFKSEVTPLGLGLLSRYCHLVAFSCYCEERLVHRTVHVSFSAWMHKFNEVSMLLQSLTKPARPSLRKEPLPPERVTENDARPLKRNGALLSKYMVLRAFPPTEHRTSAIAGVINLRQPDARAPIVACGRCTVRGRDDLFYNLGKEFHDAEELHLIDVRAEPIVYIQGQPYVMVDQQGVFDVQMATMHISGNLIENIEQRLKADIIVEAADSDGRIQIVNADAESRTVEKLWVDASDVRTPREHFDRATCPNLQLQYHRVPFPVGDDSFVQDYDPLIKLVSSLPRTSALVVEDSDGDLRATVALNLVCLVRLAMRKPLRAIETEKEMRELMATTLEDAQPISTQRCLEGRLRLQELEAEQLIELMIASSMSQMLAAGALLSTTELVVQMGGRGNEWNLLDRARSLVNMIGKATGNERQEITFAALATARKYIHVFLCAVYVDHVALQGVDKPFTEWCNGQPMIEKLLTKAEENPKQGLKLVEPSNLYLETDTGSVDRRRGNVLTANFGMKADHFPGCQRTNMTPVVPGVPNYRKVPLVNVYGVAIPTLKGIYNLLRVLGATEGRLDLYEHSEVDPTLKTTFPQRRLFVREEEDLEAPPPGRVIWFNLREEPILYIGDRPFVFRDLANPYVNVELTGIESKKIEAVEDVLRQDCLDDASCYNDRFLVHDEIKPGVMGGLWEPGTTDTIKTIRQIYDEASDLAGCRVTFVRLPVTDEQTPEITDFDIMVRNLLPEVKKGHEAGEQLSFVFNCQMGRGRTTTGMVICCMLLGVIDPAYYDALKDAYPALYPEDATPWGNGHYQVITELQRVLVDGREAKHRVDLILEACSKMQNLRTAVETFKNTAESPESSEEARARALHHGQHYLMRYFYLIVFNSYLHEQWDQESGSFGRTFAEWMARRDELSHFSRQCALK